MNYIMSLPLVSSYMCNDILSDLDTQEAYLCKLSW